MNTPYNLLNKMASVPLQYGMWDKVNNRAITGKEFDDLNGMPDIDHRCIVLKPEEVWKKKLCTCWDATILEYVELKKMGYKPKGVYYECYKGKNIVTTHAFIIYEEKNIGLYWFEYTYYKQCGLHGPYNKEDDIYDLIMFNENRDGKRITMWNKNMDIEKLLSLSEIGILDFVKIVTGRDS